MFVAKNGAFLEKEFLSRELSGRKIELDEVVEPLIPLDGGARQGETSVVATRLRRKLMIMIMKLRFKFLSNHAGRRDHVLLQSGTVIPSYQSCCWTTMNLQIMKKQWWAQIPTNG